ncbi:MAG TPA: hypothetical protein HPP58_04780 [Deltaproteobacteria bacterium]|nr:hypothetical protein [Deltaproteobacteria bacterium]
MEGPKNLAKASRNFNAKLIHISASFMWQFTLSSFRAWPPSFWRA